MNSASLHTIDFELDAVHAHEIQVEQRTRRTTDTDSNNGKIAYPALEPLYILSVIVDENVRFAMVE